MSIDHASELPEDEPSGPPLSKLQYGKPRFERRLSDKILAACNHAYAIGEFELAESLKTHLKYVEDKERAQYASSASHFLSARRSSPPDALHQVDLWKAYMDARSHYHALALQKSIPAARVESARDEMKNCFARWALA